MAQSVRARTRGIYPLWYDEMVCHILFCDPLIDCWEILVSQVWPHGSPARQSSPRCSKHTSLGWWCACWSAEGHPSALGQILHLSQGGVCSHATSAAASSIFAFAYCCKSRKVRGCTRRILATAPRQRNWRKFEQRCLHEIPWRQHRGNELALPVPLRASAQGL